MQGQGVDPQREAPRDENSQVRESIRKIEWKDGTVRYRLVVDIGRDESGKRQQITRTLTS